MLLHKLPLLENALQCTGAWEAAGLDGSVSREKLESQVFAIRRGLAILSAEERQVLWRMVAEREERALDALCESCACEKSTVYRKRKQALDKFTLALFGRI